MRIGPIAHGILLVTMLVFAYTTWTREDKVDRKLGDVKVWTESTQELSAVVYETERRTIRVEWRGEGDDRYLWGIETRTIVKPKRKPTPEEPNPPEPENETQVREFAVGEKGVAMAENLAKLRALRSLGELGDVEKKEYGLDESTDTVSVAFQGKTRSLVIGGKVYGGADRYVMDVDANKAYAVASAVLQDLMTGESALRLAKVHAFEAADVAKAVIAVGDKSRPLVQITRTDDKGKETKTWADEATPDKPEQTMANFLKAVDRLRPAAYEPERKPSELTLLVKVEYQDASGAPMGWLEFYEMAPEPEPPAPAPEDGAPAAPEAGAEGAAPADGADKPAGADEPAAEDADKPAAGDAAGEPAPPAEAKKPEPPKPAPEPEYYMRTELTRSLATVSKAAAARISEDLHQIFAAE